jgi:acetyl-CoA synthetase
MTDSRPLLVVPEDPHRSPSGREQDRAWAAYVRELPVPAPPFEKQWAQYRRIYRDRLDGDGPPLAWMPSPEVVDRANITALRQAVGLPSYTDLYQWSVHRRSEFIEDAVRRLSVQFARSPRTVMDGVDPRHVSWFPGAIMSCVDSCFTAAPDHPAIVFARETDGEPVVVTYGDLEDRVNRVASGLRAMGLKGRGVALYMPMNIECVIAYLAVIRAGGFVVSIADSFAAGELQKRLVLGGAAAVITMDWYVRDGKEMRLYDKVIQADAPDAIVVPAPGQKATPRRSGDVPWDQVYRHSDRSGGEWAHGAADDTINVLFSSGTTGTPKVIPWVQATPIKTVMDGYFHQDIHAGDVLAWPTNIGWMMGPWLIFNTLMNGVTMALFEGNPGSAAFTDFVATAKVTMLGVIPSLVRAWRRQNIPNGDGWDTVRILSSTGEASNQEDYLWLMSRTRYRAPVIECLGGTEIGGGHITGSVVQPASPATFTTPTLGTEIVLLDDAGAVCGQGGQGELFLVPPALGLSQRLVGQDHDQVYYAGTPPNGETLRRHGDQMVHLANGFVKALGRADDTMNLGGIKISAREIEIVVDAHPAVYESAAIAVQPTGGGADHLVVYVVLREPAPPRALKDRLSAIIASELNPLFHLYDLVVVDVLPRTASNKVMRRELRERYRAASPSIPADH